MKYSSAGKYNSSGLPTLIVEGQELLRQQKSLQKVDKHHISSIDNDIKQEENVLPEVLPGETNPTTFILIKLNPTMDTEIILPIQNHPVCVIGDPDIDSTVISVRYFTSSEYITKKPLMCDTQLLSGEDKK